MIAYSRNKMNTAVYIFMFFLLIIVLLSSFGFNSSADDFLLSPSSCDRNKTTDLKPQDTYLNHRKLKLNGICTKWDISISQSRYPTSGIPIYTVQIANTCVSSSGCAPSNIHLHCGWFASARIVNPRMFKRLSFDDCLVNGGRPLRSSQIIRFTYANTFMYPLEFKSAIFC